MYEFSKDKRHSVTVPQRRPHPPERDGRRTLPSLGCRSAFPKLAMSGHNKDASTSRKRNEIENRGHPLSTELKLFSYGINKGVPPSGTTWATEQERCS